MGCVVRVTQRKGGLGTQEGVLGRVVFVATGGDVHEGRDAVLGQNVFLAAILQNPLFAQKFGAIAMVICDTYSPTGSTTTVPQLIPVAVHGRSRCTLFYLSFAQASCSKNTDARLANHLPDPHPPGRFRVTGVLQNNAEFTREFQCPTNSYLNPSKKCLWE
ncbi:hypothetical protein DYB31_015469 [Aphanomyces astaci]|uniref:Peptidase M13 C-terminal domain-containing protein n=1 Tax=Aphanomyces astaci TaxID=112090 RepID=A0A397F232_APHAT|nr:hypothetical protein DYB31_015469 [Aphanomyces astaci]